MSKVIIQSIGMSLDGFSAGADQSMDEPLGVLGKDLMGWFFPTKTFTTMVGGEGGETGVDDGVAAAGFGHGAWILGRNMFGPIRGPWPDDEWKGWWGAEPPYHVPTFVLTHYARAPIEMKGGTTFHFVTDGVHSALEQAKAAAGDHNVRIGGGPETIRQFLSARLVDELHIALRPLFLGKGEPLLAGLNLRQLGYHVDRMVPGERAVHMFIKKSE